LSRGVPERSWDDFMHCNALAADSNASGRSKLQNDSNRFGSPKSLETRGAKDNTLDGILRGV
jgi:hypothetical protein